MNSPYILGDIVQHDKQLALMESFNEAHLVAIMEPFLEPNHQESNEKPHSPSH
jgi:hypothetical protein